tara:strand:- start:6948 stop:7532 length:585 start_codon:yes stop_codon:yes gene_type:complete
MNLDELELQKKYFVSYKFLNSLFMGLSIGSIFTIYTPLEPSVYSVGGIALALGMLLVATQYHKILTIKYFYRISLLVEIIILGVVISFLIFSYSYKIAMLVYLGYQITFVFGSYLVRGETLILRQDKLLKAVDIAKQSGYLSGLLFSYLFYEFVDYFFALTDNQSQVFYLHYPLLVIEVLVILSLLFSFRRSKL